MHDRAARGVLLSLVLALALPLAADGGTATPAVPPVAEAPAADAVDPKSCALEGTALVTPSSREACTFLCDAGDTVTVAARGLPVWQVTGSCNGVSTACSILTTRDCANDACCARTRSIGTCLIMGVPIGVRERVACGARA